MNAIIRPRLLCVDDEPAVLEGLELLLRRECEVVTATRPLDALALIDKGPEFAVVISDMRMPVMDGAHFLARVREKTPDTVRLLLTGYADLASAITAINDGQVFRILTKPCPAEKMRLAVAEALRQHQLLMAEHELLERTLRGAVQTLSDVMALAEPAAFGKANRVLTHAIALAKHLQLQPLWPLELAARLNPIGMVSLPPELVEKLQRGDDLSVQEQAMISRVPEVSVRLLKHIPRLEVVCDILQFVHDANAATTAPSGSSDLRYRLYAARVLRLAEAYETLLSQGKTASAALAQLAADGNHDKALLEHLGSLVREQPQGPEVRPVPVRLLQAGMVLTEDLRTQGGTLLAPRGYVVTAGFMERVRNFPDSAISSAVKVLISSTDVNKSAVA